MILSVTKLHFWNEMTKRNVYLPLSQPQLFMSKSKWGWEVKDKGYEKPQPILVLPKDTKYAVSLCHQAE